MISERCRYPADRTSTSAQSGRSPRRRSKPIRTSADCETTGVAAGESSEDTYHQGVLDGIGEWHGKQRWEESFRNLKDYNAPGCWIFHASVRAFYETNKIGVRVRSSNRTGYITGVLEEDHSACKGAHDGCRVQVYLAGSRNTTITTVDVRDVDPCRPSKKNSLALQIRGFEGTVARLLVARGVPRLREQPITVCEPGKENQIFYIPGSQLTTVMGK